MHMGERKMKLCMHPAPIANHPINFRFADYFVAWEPVQKVPCDFAGMVEDQPFLAAKI
jgi:hypothetical protein